MTVSTIEQSQDKPIRPPRAMAWILLLASTAAVLLAGVAATALVFGTVGSWERPPLTFWPRLLVACGLTVASLTLRSLRWIFLLRRAETRIPIRDAYIGYIAGLSLLFTPLLLGEITIRAAILKRRGRVPVLTTAVVNLVERACDLLALGLVASVLVFPSGRGTLWAGGMLVAVGLSWLTPLRRWTIERGVRILAPICRVFDPIDARSFDRLVGPRTWATAMVCSLAVWILPGIGLWFIAGTWLPELGLATAQRVYAASATIGGLVLAPGGVLVAGPEMLQGLDEARVPESIAALTVLGIRLATVGVAVALGAMFVLFHMRTAAAGGGDHFDDIADAYDVQIPESRRLSLLDRKTQLMQQVIQARGVGPRGIDVGCGQGAYVGQMRALGLDVTGIDASQGQVRFAQRKLGPDAVRAGSALDIPAGDQSLDFLYTINVLHHLSSVDEQRRAFTEMLRVLKPGGLIFVHEINTRNVLFRFYMGYVFPSLNCIDEGVERWLLPHRLSEYTSAPVASVEYFTFLPDFVPAWMVRRLSPVERWLEASKWRVYSAHYMAVLVKPSEPPR